MAKVSIIVPVYNCAKYLKRCVDSILAQTERDLQLILVDDGSADGSGAICDEYAGKDPRVLVIHQKNAGVSAARNAGLDAAMGEYISFVDADDTLEPNMVERTTAAAAVSPQIGLVLFDPFVHQEGAKTVLVDSMPFYPESIMINKEEIMPENLRYMAGTVWRVLYQRDLIEKNKLRFDTTLPLSEDRIFNIIAMGCSEKIYYLREPLYHYLINSGGAVGKYRENMLEVVLNTHEQTQKALSEYWSERFMPVYERIDLVDGALLCVYNVFSPRNTQKLSRKYAAIKRAVNTPAVCEAYGKLDKMSLRQWLVRHKCCWLLCIVSVLWNLKNKR